MKEKETEVNVLKEMLKSSKTLIKHKENEIERMKRSIGLSVSDSNSNIRLPKIPSVQSPQAASFGRGNQLYPSNTIFSANSSTTNKYQKAYYNNGTKLQPLNHNMDRRSGTLISCFIMLSSKWGASLCRWYRLYDRQRTRKWDTQHREEEKSQ